MFVDDIRTILNPGSAPEYRKNLLQKYADVFRKSSAAISEWTGQEDCDAGIRDEAWKLFCEYCRIVLALTVGNGKKDVCELENSQPLVNGFLSVLFPGKDYADEIHARLNYIAKRAFDAAWSEDADSCGPMDSLDSFRRMLVFQVEQTVEARRARREKEHESESVVSLGTQLLEIVYDLSRYQPGQREYKRYERLYDSVLCVLKEIGRNGLGNASPEFKFNSAWEIRVSLKDHVRLTGTDSSDRRIKPTWDTVCSMKNALCKTRIRPDKQYSRPKRNSR